MPQNPVKIRATFKLTSTATDGIDIIKEALLTAKHALNDDKWKLEFKMYASPLYRVEVTTQARAQGEEKIKAALKIIKRVMKERDGKFSASKDPIEVIGQ